MYPIFLAQALSVLGSLITLVIIAVVLAAAIRLVQIWIPLPPAVSQTAWLLFGIVVLVFGLRFLLGLL